MTKPKSSESFCDTFSKFLNATCVAGAAMTVISYLTKM